MNAPSSRYVWITVAFLAAVAVLAAHASYYLPYISDDSLISLRYADRLLHGKGLTWTDGIRVEGYSNLLWILVVCCLGAVGVDLIMAARILGMIGMTLVIGAVLWRHTRANALKPIWISFVSGIPFFCLTAPVAVWAIGGLEQPLFAALLSISIASCAEIIESSNINIRTVFTSSIALGLMCITRLDGPIFTVAAVLTVLFLWHNNFTAARIHTVFYLLSFPILFYSGQIIFRLYYYGEWIPNTALVKFTPSTHHFTEGLQYVNQGMQALSPFSWLAVLSMMVALRFQETKGSAILLITMSVLWIGYITVIGGDIFPAWRHFIPVIVIFTFALVEGSYLIWPFLKQRSNTQCFLVTVIVVATFYLMAQFENPSNKGAISEREEWDGKVIGQLLDKAFAKQQPLIAVSVAGSLPYWSKLPALDMLGLNDYYLPRHPPADIGLGGIGHELGNGRYILDMKPDIIAFYGLHNGDLFRSSREMQNTREFYDTYTPVRMRGTDPYEYKATLWINRYSKKIGIHRSPSEVTIPGFMLNAGKNSFAYLNRADKLVVSVAAGQSAGIDLDHPLQGKWGCTVRASSNDRITCHMQERGGVTELSLVAGSTIPIEVEEVVLISENRSNE